MRLCRLSETENMKIHYKTDKEHINWQEVADVLKRSGLSDHTPKEQEIVFTNKEFDLITCLAENPDRIFSKDELFEKIWKYDSMGETSTVTVHVNRIRDKIFAVDKNFEYINTVWGRGYRFNK